MPAWLAQQEDKNGLMEAACLQAVSASLANPDGVRAPRLHPRYFLRSRPCQHGWHNKMMKISDFHLRIINNLQRFSEEWRRHTFPLRSLSIHKRRGENVRLEH
jgi:hypothetical protein